MASTDDISIDTLLHTIDLAGVLGIAVSVNTRYFKFQLPIDKIVILTHKNIPALSSISDTLWSYS